MNGPTACIQCSRAMSSAGLAMLLPTCLRTLVRRPVSTSAPLAAARKGTRERKKAKIVKKEEVKTEWVPHNVRRAQLLSLQPRANRRFDRDRLSAPIDDVYVRNWFRWPEYAVEEAVAMHRQTHHPSVFNQPEALMFVTAELDMQMDRKTRYADPVRRVLSLPHPFEYRPPRELAVFCQSAEMRQLAESCGVAVVGGTELIKQFQSGALAADQFDYFVGHPELAQELVPIRGLLKRKFPSIKDGTLTTELAPAIDRFRHGLELISEKDEYQLDFAQIVVPVGRLHMDPAHVAENVAALVAELNAARPRGHTRPFVTRLTSWCHPVPERFDLQLTQSQQLEEAAEAQG